MTQMKIIDIEQESVRRSVSDPKPFPNTVNVVSVCPGGGDNGKTLPADNRSIDIVELSHTEPTPVPLKTQSITVQVDDEEPVVVKRGRGRPKIDPARRKENNMRNRVVLYLSYPSEDQVQRLRNMAKGFNIANELRFARLLKIANSPSEAMQMLAAQGKERAEIERRYRVWVRQQARLKKEAKEREFRQTVRVLAKAIKTSKPIR